LPKPASKKVIYSFNIGIAEYSRFTTKTMPFERKELVCTIVKLKRPVRSNKGEKK
jgi:hypothetical protein